MVLPLQTKVPKPSWGGQWWLGSWEKWDGDRMRYEGGDACSSGKKRSTTIELKCGSVASLDSWAEPATCEYHATVITPEACDSAKTGSKSSVAQSGAAADYQSQVASDVVPLHLTEGTDANIRALVKARGIPAVVAPGSGKHAAG